MRTVCIKSVGEEKIDFLIETLELLPINLYISKYRFKTFDNLIVHYMEKENENEDLFYDTIVFAIKKCIEIFYEEKFIKNILEKNYFYLSKLERQYILEISKKVLELPDEKIGYKNDLLKNIIKEYILEERKIIIEGFVNFRIKEYKELLDRIVEVSVFSYLDLISF